MLIRNLKKIFYAFFVVVVCKVHGLYQGNPSSCDFPQLGFFISEESAISAKLGYQIDSVFNRKMEIMNQRLDVKRLSSLANEAVLTLNVVDRLEIFTTLGVMKMSLKRKTLSKTNIELQSNNSFTWSIGGRALLIFWDKTSLGVAGGYLVSYPHFEHRASHHSKYNEWQVELALSQKIDPVSFYLGGSYSYSQLGVTNLDIIYKSRNNLSMVIGCSIFANKGFSTNIEAKFFGEISLGGSLDFRF